jgi:copper chaperone CopZ
MKRQTLIPLVLLALLVGAIAWALAHRGEFAAARIEGWVESFGLWAPVAFACLYVAATVSFLPGSVLTIVGGMLFGPLWGTFYSLTGATVGATIAFLIARYLASNWVARKAGGRLKQVIEGVEAEGWRFVAFTRLVPPVSLQPVELCPRPDAHPSLALRVRFLGLHAPRRSRVRLSGVRGSGSRGRKRASYPSRPDCTRLARDFGILASVPPPDPEQAAAVTMGDPAMMRWLRAAALGFGLVLYSMSSMAIMHDMGGMNETGMYNLTVGGLAGRDDARGVDEKMREMDGVDKVHVDFENGMIMVWVKQGEILDERVVRKFVEEAGFTLDAFEEPEW